MVIFFFRVPHPPTPLVVVAPGTRSATASPSRPCTANTVVTIAEEPGATFGDVSFVAV